MATQSPGQWYEELEESGPQQYVLKLYIIGASPNSARAISNITRICEEYLKDRYTLEIIDIHQQKDLAEIDQIIALPLLVKISPAPERKLIGDMSDTDKVLKGLGIFQ